MPLQLKKQEPPFDHPDSHNLFLSGPNKPFVATREAIERYQYETILTCLLALQAKAAAHAGIDYLQVFEDPDTGDVLWFIEDGPGGTITALLPHEY